MNHRLEVIGLVARRTWLAVLRRPAVLSFSLGQPLIWMLFFGFLFERYPLADSAGELAYLDFLAPGVATMAVLFGASQSGIGWIRDLQTGFLPRILATTPADPRLILAGKIIADALRLGIQAGVVLLLAALLGARLHPSPPSLCLAFAGLLLFAGAFAALSCAVALCTQTRTAMATFVHLVNMPILFTSSALAPSRQMPDWLAAVSRCNPLTITVDALRDALLFGARPGLLDTLVPLGLLATALSLLAGSQMRRAAQRY
jgi:ABC-2 type transport system permease protein